MINSLPSKILRTTYILSSLIIILIYIRPPFNQKLYGEDLIFITIMILSYIIIGKFSMKLNNLYFSLEDYIIVILYFIFQMNLLILIMLISFLLSSILDILTTENKNNINYNKYIINLSILMLTLLFSHRSLSFIREMYSGNINLVLSILLFSTFFTLFNYILLLIDTLLKNKSKVQDILSKKALYYFSIIFLTSSTMSYITLYLYEIFQYTLVIVFTLFVIFLSYTFNAIGNLKQENIFLNSLIESYNKMISKSSYTNKLYTVINTIETIVPFYYCGIYNFIGNNEYIYPICNKNEANVDYENLKIKNLGNNPVLDLIQCGKYFYTKNENILKYFSIKKHNPNIESILIFPISNIKDTLGCILIAFDNYSPSTKEILLIEQLSKSVGVFTEEKISSIVSRKNMYTNYEDFSSILDKNICQKNLFCLSIVEIKNYAEILNTYGIDVYENIKLNLSENISKGLSSLDYILCNKKEDIKIIFNLQDGLNAGNKLEKLKKDFTNYKFNNKIEIEVLYTLVEYPMDGINKEELISKSYKILYEKGLNKNNFQLKKLN